MTVEPMAALKAARLVNEKAELKVVSLVALKVASSVIEKAELRAASLVALKVERRAAKRALSLADPLAVVKAGPTDDAKAEQRAETKGAWMVVKTAG